MNSEKTLLTAGLAALVLTAGCAEHPVLENPASAVRLQAAGTPAEHEAVAKIFEDEAARLSKKADLHRQMAKFPVKSAQIEIAQHCAALEAEYAAAAKQNLELAAIHHELAKQVAR